MSPDRTLAGANISTHRHIEKCVQIETEIIVVQWWSLAGKAGIEAPMIDAIYALIAKRAKHLDG